MYAQSNGDVSQSLFFPSPSLSYLQRASILRENWTNYQHTTQTLPATRLRFKRIMCGLEDEDDDGEIATIPDLSRGGQYQQQPYQTQQPQKSGRGGSSSNGSRSGR